MNLGYFKLKEGDTVVNLGAHRGKATLFYSSIVGKTGSVISIEPMKENFEVLQNMVREAGCYNVTLLNVAIGDKNEMGSLFIGTNSVNHSTTRNHGLGIQPVEIITWDELVKRTQLDDVTLAKIDVEGAELQWLRGMTRQYPKHIIMEEHSRFGYDVNVLMKMLRDKEYLYDKKGIHIYATREN